MSYGHICVFGAAGSGKSTLAAHLVERAPKVIAYDPRGDYTGAGWRVAHDRNGVRAALREQEISGFTRISYNFNAKRTDPLAEAVWLADISDAVQGGYPVSDPRPLTLLFDEAQEAFPNRQFGKAERPLRGLLLQGRHIGARVIAVTQRPSNIHNDVRGNAAEIYCFRLPAPSDRAAVAALHVDAKRAIDGLKGRDFIKIDGEGLTLNRLEFGAGVRKL